MRTTVCGEVKCRPKPQGRFPHSDIVVFETARARWVALDNAIQHACSPSDDAFGTASRRMGRWEQAKVGTYTGSAAWCA